MFERQIDSLASSSRAFRRDQDKQVDRAIREADRRKTQRERDRRKVDEQRATSKFGPYAPRRFLPSEYLPRRYVSPWGHVRW